MCEEATDDTLLGLAPGLAQAQVVEVRVKLATDGDYELQLEDLDPLLFTANGNTQEQIRDALADQIVSPAYDPFTAKKLVTDRFRVTGAKGLPFAYSLIAPGGATTATATTVRPASGATPELRARWLALAIKLIKCDVWRDKTPEAQALLAAFFVSRALLAIASSNDLVIGGKASSLSLGGASVGLTGAGISMPSDAELASDPYYGAPLLILMQSVCYGPTWS